MATDTPELKNVLVEWLEDERRQALLALSAWGMSPSVNVRRTVVTEFDERSARYSYQSEQVSPLSIPDLAWRLDSMIRDESLRDRVAKTLHETFGDSCKRFTIGSNVDFDADPKTWIKGHLLGPLQTEYLSGLSSLDEGSGEKALNLALQLVHHVSSETLTRVDLLPLAGLRLSDDELNVKPFLVRKLTHEELGDLSDAYRDFFRPWKTRLPRVLPGQTQERVALEARFPFTKQIAPHEPGRLHRLVMALQLLSFEPHGSGRAAYWTEPVPHAATGSSLIRLPSDGDTKPLTRERFEEAVVLSDQIPRDAVFSPRSRRDLALHRFHLGAAETSPADRLVNFVIALEAFLLPPSFDGELGFKFALYGARFLGDTQSKRRSAFNELQAVYRMRSKVVHGAAPPTTSELIEAAAVARRLAESLLVRGLREGWPQADAFKDEAIGSPKSIPSR